MCEVWPVTHLRQIHPAITVVVTGHALNTDRPSKKPKEKSYQVKQGETFFEIVENLGMRCAKIYLLAVAFIPC